MVAQRSLKSQLSRLRLHFWFFGRSEINELRKILEPSEVIRHCARGYYDGGSGILVATNKRLMLIDKRPFYLNLEEMKYELIRDVRFDQKFLQATLMIRTNAKNLMFRSVSDARLRQMQQFVSDEISLAKKHFAESLSDSRLSKMDNQKHQHPAWTPHNPMLLKRRRPTKFYSPSRLAPLS